MQMRLGFSNMNGDLAKHCCVPNPYCKCRSHSEDVNHYFLQCPLYSTAHQRLLETDNERHGGLHIDTNVLLNYQFTFISFYYYIVIFAIITLFYSTAKVPVIKPLFTYLLISNCLPKMSLLLSMY